MRIKALLLILFVGFALPHTFSCDGGKGRNLKKEPTKQDAGGQITPDYKTAIPDPTAHPEPVKPDQRTPAPERVSPPEPNPPTPDTHSNPEPTTPDTPTTPDIPKVADVPTTPDIPTKPDTPAPTAQGIRFIAMGDTGTGTAKQKAVAQAIKAKCAAESKPGGRGPCDFAILLGDNFYDVGVTSDTDPLFKTHFVDMYHSLGFPFYITVGNHDFGVKGLGGVGFGFSKLKHYLSYAKKDPQFVLPQSYYSFKKQNVSFISLNTAELFFDYNTKAQTSYVRKFITNAKSSTWKIAFGHHPYISNGKHGNAGKYEGLSFIPYVSGRKIKKFFDSEICGKVDYYFCGHDHNIQLLHAKCGTGFAVAGAGAKNTKFSDPKRNPNYWQSDSKIGFLYVHIKGRTMTIQVINSLGKQEYEKVFMK